MDRVRTHGTIVRERERAITDRHPDLVTAETAALLVVDVQEAFRHHIAGFDEMVAAIALLVSAAPLLDVPVVVTEQYPEGLGRTVAELDELTGAASRYDKLEISACRAAAFDRLPQRILDARTVIVTGIETHVCVNQTVHDLLHRGTRVHVVADAVGSRDPWQREVALERLARAGAVVTSAESVLFELLGVAGSDSFKAVQKLIKQHDAARRDRESSHNSQAIEVGA